MYVFIVEHKHYPCDVVVMILARDGKVRFLARMFYLLFFRIVEDLAYRFRSLNKVHSQISQIKHIILSQVMAYSLDIFKYSRLWS